MPRLPDTLGARKTPNVSRRIHSVDMTQVARAQGQAAQQLVNAGRDLGDMAAMRQREEDELKRNRTRHIKNEARRQLDEYVIGNDKQEGLFQRTGSNGVSIEKDYDDRFTQIREKALKDAGDGKYSELLEMELDDLNTSYRARVLSHQTKQREDYRAQVVSANASNAINDIGYFYNDDAAVEKNIHVIEASLNVMGKAQGWDEDTMKMRKQEGRSEAYSTQLQSMIATDNPMLIKQAYDKFKKHEENQTLTLAHRAKLDKYFDTAMPVITAKVEFGKLSSNVPSNASDIASFIINGLEIDKQNPDKVYIDNDGGLTKYGINKNHNPDVDVKNLTYDGAKQITINKYYNSVNADELPENMRLIAADAAFNHGPAKANKMIKKAGGDPYKLLKLRKAEYDRLNATGKKEFTESYDGWMKRLGDLEAKLIGNGEKIDGDALFTRAKELDAEIPGAGQELIGMYERQQAATRKVETARKTELTTNARQKLAENGGDYTQFTTQERAQYAEAGIDVTNLYKDFDEPSAVTELTLMTGETLLSTDIDAQFGGRLKFDTLETWKQKQESLKDPANKHVEDQIDGVINRYFLDAGLDPNDKSGKDSNKQFVANMKSYIQNVAVRERSAGKEVTPKRIIRGLKTIQHLAF